MITMGIKMLFCSQIEPRLAIFIVPQMTQMPLALLPVGASSRTPVYSGRHPNTTKDDIGTHNTGYSMRNL